MKNTQPTHAKIWCSNSKRLYFCVISTVVVLSILTLTFSIILPLTIYSDVSEHLKKYDSFIRCEALINEKSESQYYKNAESAYSSTSTILYIVDPKSDQKIISTGLIIIPPDYGKYEGIDNKEIDIQTKKLLDLKEKKSKIIPVIIDGNNISTSNNIVFLGVPNFSDMFVSMIIYVIIGILLGLITPLPTILCCCLKKNDN